MSTTAHRCASAGRLKASRSASFASISGGRVYSFPLLFFFLSGSIVIAVILKSGSRHINRLADSKPVKKLLLFLCATWKENDGRKRRHRYCQRNCGALCGATTAWTEYLAPRPRRNLPPAATYGRKPPASHARIASSGPLACMAEGPTGLTPDPKYLHDAYCLSLHLAPRMDIGGPDGMIGVCTQ